MATQDDLFGGGSAQGNLFGDGRMETPEASHLPKPEDIRRRLHRLLAKARDAKALPWNERDARMYQTIFPQMANWLPQEEADQLRFAFAQELERLMAA